MSIFHFTEEEKVIVDIDQKKLPKKIRPSWDEYFFRIVEVTSERSPCERLQVGCILVIENRIISQGYNGYLPNCPHQSIMRDEHEQAIVHAEQNAIVDCAKRGVSCRGCTVYITHYPCIICARLLLACEVKEIRYRKDYKNDPLVEVLASQAKVPINKFHSEDEEKQEKRIFSFACLLDE